jgi:exo-beta-1,3-glucanase (GH17 family)
VPVTTADDFSFWNRPGSAVLAREVDFIVAHAYAMWNKQPLDRAISFTKEKYSEVAAAHPDHQIVLGEAGWATKKHNQGEQSWLIVGEAGESQQESFYTDFVAWTTRERITNFYFEAFDENWKGGPHPNEVEKHWGLYRADRTPKKAMTGQ